tara:strand:+ start:251 stop:535 length:285 start_codon:yes stop_codon:yes gene_type:complete
MLKKIKKVTAIIASIALMSSCSITMPVAATSNPIGSKVGTATGTCYLGVLCLGADASIQSAAKAGGITKISTVDMKRGDVFGIITTYQTIVTGE